MTSATQNDASTMDFAGKAVAACVFVPIALTFIILATGSDAYNPEAAMLLVGITMMVYLLPAIIAAARRHHQTLAILLFNLFLGWTFIGWVGALIWASTAVKRRDTNGMIA